MVIVFKALDGSRLGVTCDIEPDFKNGFLAHLIEDGFEPIIDIGV